MTSAHKAENAAATFLLSRGHKIIDRNWRHPRAEIDIVSKKMQILYFTEVKYRKSGRFGSGIEYISTKKASQMGYSANLYAQLNNIEDQIVLSAIEVEGCKFKVTKYIEVII